MSHEMKCTWPSCSHTAKDQCRTDWVLRSEAHITARAADPDTITALRAENEDLGNRLHHVHRLWANSEHALRVENERLRAALEAFAEHFGPLEDNMMLHDGAKRCFALARAALGEKQ